MQKIVECVPNFSEGRDLKKINVIFDAAKIASVKAFELEYNKDHNRMLFTIVGEPEAVLASVFESIKTATKLIDMNKHVGEHPRIGATDVVPFVPVSGVTMKECVEISNQLAKKVADELGIPVFMYEEAALKPENRNLADIRVGEYEGLKGISVEKIDTGTLAGKRQRSELLLKLKDEAGMKYGEILKLPLFRDIKYNSIATLYNRFKAKIGDNC